MLCFRTESKTHEMLTIDAVNTSRIVVVTMMMMVVLRDHNFKSNDLCSRATDRKRVSKPVIYTATHRHRTTNDIAQSRSRAKETANTSSLRKIKYS